MACQDCNCGKKEMEEAFKLKESTMKIEETLGPAMLDYKQQAKDEMLKSYVEDLKNSTAGKKHDSGKPAMSLIPPDALIEVGKVMEFGKRKYDQHNWHKGIVFTRLLDAANRHIKKFESPIQPDLDEESNISHLAHAATNILMALQFVLENRTELDDRLKK